MQEYIVIIWNFHERGGAKAAMAMLRRCDLRHEAQQEIDVPMDDPDTDEPWSTGSFGSVRLRVDDPRIPGLRRELEAAQVKPFERFERVYSKKDLEVPWLAVTGSTTMVGAGNLKGQKWDFTAACAECGAGAVPVPPLIVRISGKPPKQGWSVTVPCRLVVVSAKLASVLEKAKLTGFTVEPVRMPSKETVDARYRWLRIPCAWPLPRAGRRVCEECGRPSAFGDDSGPRFGREPKGAKDFNACQGMVPAEDRIPGVVNRPTGSAPDLIISRGAYEVLCGAGVRNLRCEPVEFG